VLVFSTNQWFALMTEILLMKEPLATPTHASQQVLYDLGGLDVSKHDSLTLPPVKKLKKSRNKTKCSTSSFTFALPPSLSS
jgi:hypothetical protein